MNTKHVLSLTALAALMTVAAPAVQAEAPGMEKCFGVVKAGANDCATGAHSCAGHSAKDADPAEWVNVPAGLCGKLAGGTTEAGGAMMKK